MNLTRALRFEYFRMDLRCSDVSRNGSYVFSLLGRKPRETSVPANSVAKVDIQLLG